jgi:hypothetical protein
LPFADAGENVNPEVAGIAHCGIGLPIATVMMISRWLSLLLIELLGILND